MRFCPRQRHSFSGKVWPIVPQSSRFRSLPPPPPMKVKCAPVAMRRMVDHLTYPAMQRRTTRKTNLFFLSIMLRARRLEVPGLSASDVTTPSSLRFGSLSPSTRDLDFAARLTLLRAQASALIETLPAASLFNWALVDHPNSFRPRVQLPQKLMRYC